MAITTVSANRGQLTSAAGGSNPTVVLTTGASITGGNSLIMVCSYDNSGTLGVDPNMWVVSSSVAATQVYGIDLRGNYWFRIARAVRTSGAANDGSVADIWACLVANAYANSDPITLQFSFPVANVNIQIAEYAGINPRSYSVVSAITGTGNGTTIGPTGTITPLTVGQMVIGVAAVEDNTAITGDGDTTGGAWVTIGTFGIGAGATGNSIMAQSKVVTTTAAQDWDVTKTGAADWAALAVVFDAFTNVPSTFVSGNPNYPCIAGAEILPLGYDNLPVDTGTEYLQTHQVPPNSYGTQNYQVATYTIFAPAGSAASYAHHAIIHDIYPSGGADEVIDEVFTQSLSVSAAGLGAGATVSSGSTGDAIGYVGGAYVTLPNGGYVDVLFNPTILTGLFFNYRIVRWGIRYLAWKDDGAAPGPGEGIITEWRDSGANNGAGAAATISAWLVQNYKRDVQLETRWIGEVNPIIRGKGEILAQNAPFNAAFTVNDLSHMAIGDQTTRLRLYGAQGQDASQTTVYLDYVDAVVELVPERRLAHGTELISNAPTFVSSTFYGPGLGATQTWTALNTNNRWQVPSSANPYVLATREAMPASPGDYYANQAFVTAGQVGRTVGYNEAIGPSWLLRALPQPHATLANTAATGQPTLRRGVVNGGVLASVPEAFENFIISEAAFDLIRASLEGSFYPAYDFGGVIGDFSEIYTASVLTPRVIVNGATQFNRVKVLVYPDELTTANLTITVEQPALTVLASATITPAQALALPDVGNGWREISVALNVAVTPTAGQVTIRLASTTPATAPWRLAEAEPIGGNDVFGYNFTQQQVDEAVVLQCTLANPTASLGNSVQNLYRPDGRCLSTTITLPTITLTNGATYDWISIERTLDNGTTYTPVTLLFDPTNAQVYTDTAVPWDQTALTVKYRITGYRNADHLTVTTLTAGWNAVATAPGAAFGLAAPGGTLYAYVPVDESSLQVQWNPLNPVSLVPLFGVDYQIPLRAPEERGLSTSFLVLVDQLLACAPGTVPWTETLSAGQNSMSPTPFAAVRAQAEVDTFNLILPGGYRHFVTLSLGTLTIKTAAGLFLAEVTLTDVPDISIDPYAP